MYEKILIISPSWIGDCIMSQSLLQVLLNTRNNVKIDVYANKHLIPILHKMPQINNIIENPFIHGDIKLFKRYKNGIELRKNNYTQSIVLPGSFKSALMPFFANIPIRTGFKGEFRGKLLNDIRHLDKIKLCKIVDRYISLAFPVNSKLPGNIPFPRLELDKKVQQNTLKKFQLEKYKKIIAFCPGADYGSSKRWPTKHFAKLARYFYTKGFNIWIFGSDNDIEIGKNIVDEADVKCVNLCGKTSLDEAINLLGFVSLGICNDSGLMHICSALAIPLIALYGSTTSNHTPPLSKKAKSLSLNLDCSPCFRRECHLKHLNCMNLLLPELVFKEALDLID